MPRSTTEERRNVCDGSERSSERFETSSIERVGGNFRSREEGMPIVTVLTWKEVNFRL